MDCEEGSTTLRDSLGMEDEQGCLNVLPLQANRLGETANMVHKHLVSRTLPTLDDLAEERGLQKKTLTIQMNAVAELFSRHHEEHAQNACRYVESLGLSGAVRPIAYLEHVLYDETPLRARVRVNGVRHLEKSKAFVLEPSWAILVRRSAMDAPAPQDPTAPTIAPSADYLLLLGKHPVSLRAGEGTSGEALLPVLRSIPSPPAFATSFDHHWRVIECDEAGGNRRAEQLLSLERPKSWKTTTVLCTAHKVHACAERTWSLQPFPQIMSGLINTSLYLKNPGCMRLLREALEQQLREMPLDILRSPASSAAAASHRSWLVQLLGPGFKNQPRRQALLEVISQNLLNGDWSKPCLQHHCPASCCSSLEETRNKLSKYVVKILMALPPHVLNRSNWLDWHKGVRLYALLEAMHGLWSASFRRAFAANTAGPRSDMQLAFAQPLEVEESENPILQAQAQPQPLPQLVNDNVNLLDANEDKKRAERLQHFRAALALLDTPAWLDSLLVMLQCLRPQKDLMSQVLWKTGAVFERQQLEAMAATGAREWRALHLHQERDLNDFFQTAMVNLHDKNLWQLEHVLDTEEYRSLVFTAAVRGPATMFQQVTLRVRGFPFRLLQLLVENTPEHAETILKTPQCLLDGLSLSLLRKYNTAALLCNDTDLRQILSTLGHLVLCTTYTTERLHSKHSRRNRPDTHAKTLEQFALVHSTWLGPSFSTTPPHARAKGKTGRPRKEMKEQVASDIPHNPKPKRRKGGGGAWRAYIHHRCEQGAAANFATMRDEYRNLTEQQLQFYREIGRLGATGEKAKKNFSGWQGRRVFANNPSPECLF